MKPRSWKCPNQDCPTLTWLWGSACVCSYLGHWLKIAMWVNLSIFQIVLPGLFLAKREFQKLSPETIVRFVKPLSWDGKKDEVLQELPRTWLKQPTTMSWMSWKRSIGSIKQIQDRSKLSEEELNRTSLVSCAFRQICDTLPFFMEDYQGDSGKLESLSRLLGQPRMANTGFDLLSQFRGMLIS